MFQLLVICHVAACMGLWPNTSLTDFLTCSWLRKGGDMSSGTSLLDQPRAKCSMTELAFAFEECPIWYFWATASRPLTTGIDDLIGSWPANLSFGSTW